MLPGITLIASLKFPTGPSTNLTPNQEERLSAWIKAMSSVGYGKTKKEIPMIVKQILDEVIFLDDSLTPNY